MLRTYILGPEPRAHHAASELSYEPTRATPLGPFVPSLAEPIEEQLG